jgi:hypothetical protein
MTSFAIAPTKSATTLFSEDGLTLSNDHIAIFLVLICAWKRYVVDVCFYMNDIHVQNVSSNLLTDLLLSKTKFRKLCKYILFVVPVQSFG